MLLLVGILHKLLKHLQNFLYFGTSACLKRIYHFLQNKFNQAISYIPGTKLFYKRSRREVIERTGIWIKSFFEDSNAFDPVTKRNLLPSIRYYGHQLWGARVFLENTVTIAMPIFMILGFATAIFLSPYLTNALWHYFGYSVNREKLTSDYFSNYYFVTTIGIFAMGFPYTLLDFLSQWFRLLKSFWVFVAAGFIWPTCLSISYGIQVYKSFDSITDDPKLVKQIDGRNLLFVDARIAVIGTYIVLLVIFLGLAIAVFLWRKQVRSNYPDATIIDKLLSILHTSEKMSKWRNLRNRQKIINELEGVATCIQNDIPRRMYSSDLITNSWQKRVTEEIAAEVRSLKKWVCLPRADTREQFVKRINRILICVANSDWDSLERAKPENSFQILQTRIKNLGHVLSRALLLPLTFWIFQQTPLALKGQSADYLTVGVFVIASLTFLTEFDPHFSARLSVLKEVIQLLPLPGKDKKP